MTGSIFIAPFPGDFRNPSARYTVHVPGAMPGRFRTVREAKAWAAESFGVTKWEKRGVAWYPKCSLEPDRIEPNTPERSN